MAKTRFFSVYKLPLTLQPNSFYHVYSKDNWESYLTNNKREIKPIGNSEMINSLIDIKLSNADSIFETKEVKDYRSDFDSPSSFIYSGFHLNTIPLIKRVKDNIEEVAQNLNNLETDWTNRLTLTYI